MTPTQQSELELLFDKICQKIITGEIGYDSVKADLEKTCTGKIVCPEYVPRDFPYALIPIQTFPVRQTTITQKLEVKHNEGKRPYFTGYENRSLRLRLTEFFYDSPATASGTGTVFTSIKRITLADVVKNLLGVNSFNRTTAIQEIIDGGISFSTEQVLKILASDIIKEPRHKGIIFFVHNSNNDDIGVIIKNNIQKGLWGKSFDEDSYAFSQGTLVVSRNPVAHLEVK